MKMVLISTALMAAMVCFHIKAGEMSGGQELFERRCAGCHGLDRVKGGPPLRRAFGRRAGSLPAFTYSDALKKAEFRWSEETLERWLTDPESLVPETDMEFRLTNPEERQQIIAYLKQISARK